MSKEIVTIGGGTGSPDLNRSLLLTEKVQFIRAIAAVFDSGGATGRRRLNSEGREPAFSDAMRILFSLVMPSDQDAKFVATRALFSHRDSRDEVLGQEIFNRYFDQESGYSKVEEYLKSLGINLMGTVIPSTTHSADILFTTASGRQHLGEHELDAKVMSKDVVIDMVLHPKVPAFAPAMDALRQAKVIFLSFGSIHGSLLCNFLPDGMREAVSESQAKIFLVTNLVSTRSETHNISPQDYVKLVRKYTGVNVDAIIVPVMTRSQFESRHPEVAALYDLEYSHFLGWEQQELYEVEKEGVTVVAHRATKIIEVLDGKTKIVRHDPSKLAETLKEIL